MFAASCAHGMPNNEFRMAVLFKQRPDYALVIIYTPNIASFRKGAVCLALGKGERGIFIMYAVKGFHGGDMVELKMGLVNLEVQEIPFSSIFRAVQR